MSPIPKPVSCPGGLFATPYSKMALERLPARIFPSGQLNNGKRALN